MILESTLTLPKDYTPFNELIICSNQFVNGKVPLRLKNNIPFLVGVGRDPIPLVWLSVPVSKDGKEWQEIVTKNKSMNRKIVMIASEESSSVTVIMDGQTLIQVKKISNDKAEIINLDLRPLGLNIYGNNNGLYIGTNVLSNNSFSNVDTMVDLG